ncbi:O-Antigen ligase [Anatilimnocola aggregata]|uniref:O-Antigen ligase n=1 Tax=Anatilimnocola aggregata TaxID=2528021 RepID=A0A517YGN7_9BACT|nr:O-antigen ligase family protein [Anatilimnocola aggregata]QDU29387.1 O-Antigen ligase [Anatilimnocola aggregata]
MKRRRGQHASAEASSHARESSASSIGQVAVVFSNYVRPAILAIATALLVSTPLVASESIVSEGTGASWYILWLALALFSLLGSVISVEANRRWAWPDLWIAVIVGWHLLSAALCDGNERHAWNAAWQWVAYGALAIVMRQQLLTGQETRAIVVVMMLLAVAVSLHAFYQYSVTQPALRNEFKKNPQAILQQMDVSADAAGPLLTLAENRINSLEPVGEFALTNSLAGFLLPWMLVAFALAFWLVQKGESLPTVTVFIAIAVIVFAVLILTKSRTAWLAAAGGCGLILMFGRRSGWQLDWRWPAGIAAVVLLLGLGAVATNGLDAEVLSESPKSVLYRLQYWRATAAMIGDHPWLGVGPGNFQERYAGHKLPEASETIADPHNFLLEVWSTAGTPALLALVALIFTTAWQLARQSNSELADSAVTVASRDEQEGASGRQISTFGILVGAFVGLMLAGLLGFIVFDPLETTRTSFDPRDTALGLPVVWITGFLSFGLGIYLLGNWIDRGDLPRSAIVIALVALLVNLLAAGAAIYPGVVNSAWLLWAIAMRGNQSESSASQQSPAVLNLQSPQQAINWILAGLCFVALIACNYTEYVPVMASQQLLANASEERQAGRMSLAVEYIEQAIAADPWSSTARRFLANLQFGAWLVNPSSRNWKQFVDAMDEFEKSSPHHFTQHQQRGDWLLFASRRIKNTDLLAESARAYETAVKCYPNNAFLRAQLAAVYDEQGRKADASEAAKRAAELDALCPHVEQKLEQRMLYDPHWPLTKEPVVAEKLAAENAAKVVARLRDGASSN